jgi:hypothetical protein
VVCANVLGDLGPVVQLEPTPLIEASLSVSGLVAIKLVGAVGIEENPILLKPCKQWCCSRPNRDNHYKHYKSRFGPVQS